MTLLLLLSACGTKAKEELGFFAMDTYVETSAYGENARELLDLAKEETVRLEELCSAHSESSTLYRLNSGEDVRDPELLELICRALDISRETGGAFDPTLLPLSILWGFGGDGVGAVPEDADISRALESTGYGRVSFSETGAPELNGTQLDLGGIAKGLAADSFADLAGEKGVDSAFASFGGTVCAVGEKPDGSAWRVAVRDPLSPGEYAAVLEVRDVCISTSGAYERYFTFEGRVYHHILDPGTGYPAESDLLSATVIHSSGVTADALSTALFVMGSDLALGFCAENGLSAVLITDQNELILTGDAKALATEISGNYTLRIPG